MRVGPRYVGKTDAARRLEAELEERVAFDVDRLPARILLDRTIDVGHAPAGDVGPLELEHDAVERRMLGARRVSGRANRSKVRDLAARAREALRSDLAHAAGADGLQPLLLRLAGRRRSGGWRHGVRSRRRRRRRLLALLAAPPGEEESRREGGEEDDASRHGSRC
jgi:hypothetical protein